MRPLYDLVLVFHVLAAVVGFGALAATGGYARSGRRTGLGRASAAVRRYFAPGRNLAGWALFLVPVLGFLLLGLGHWRDASVPYPWVGLGLWVAAAGLATGVAWPAEREIQALLLREGEDPSGDVGSRLEPACRRCERAALAASVLFVVAVYFMAVQPG